MEKTRADMVTVWPTQEARTWAERLVVPMMTFTILSYLPELCVRYLPWPVFAAANGQCLAFRREAYILIGGHHAVRLSLIEDMSLARNVKRKGLRLVESLGNSLISGRMYPNWPEVRDGFAKNILAGHGGQPAFLVLSAFFHWTLFLFPWIWLLAGWLAGGVDGWPAWPLAIIALGWAVRALSAAVAGDRPIDALLLPVSVLLMSAIAARSLWWHYHYGGPRWKGRQIYSRP
jgi:chlorobactene glucosyltransferase